MRAAIGDALAATSALFEERGIALEVALPEMLPPLVADRDRLIQVLLKRHTPLIRTFTQNLMAYALGRRVEYYDKPTVRAIAADAAENNYRISSFVLGVVKSDAFQMKKEVVAEQEPAGQ